MYAQFNVILNRQLHMRFTLQRRIDPANDMKTQVRFHDPAG